jgi:hypothetical protein
MPANINSTYLQPLLSDTTKTYSAHGWGARLPVTLFLK